MTQIDIAKYEKYIPDSVPNLKRFNSLYQTDTPRIAVFGTYNHGKSTLLNALVGETVFKAADKRETVKNQEHEAHGITWIDTPGLSADVRSEDDKIARQGAFEIADFIFLVHRADAGELDKYEQEIYRGLMKQDKSYQNKLFLMLTAIDLVEKEQLDTVYGKIKNQLPDMSIFPVSAVRFGKGKSAGKKKLVEQSGMQALFSRIESFADELEGLRAKEAKRLQDKALVDLAALRKATNERLKSCKYEVANQAILFGEKVQAIS